MRLSIKKIIELSAKIHSVESTKGLLPCPTSGIDKQTLIENKTIKNHKSFTPEEIKFMQENKGLFPQEQYPKMHEWLKDTSKTLGDEFKSAEPAIKENPEYQLLANLELYTRLSGEYRFFNEANLKEFHNRLAQFIGKDDPKLFQKANKLFQEMIASDSQQPIHDFFIKLNLPAAGKKWDKENWYNFLIKNGPKALLYLARADEIEAHLGRVPEALEQATNVLVKISYDRAKEVEVVENLPAGVSKDDLRAYTKLCVLQGIETDDYNRGLDILLGKKFQYEGKITQIKSRTNIPSVVIEGQDIAEKYGDPELAKYRLEVLKPQDWRMLIMGELTNCCQSIGNDAENCALEAMINENTGVVAIFKGDKIVAQSFVWLGEEDEHKQKTFVFDSWERLNPNLNFLCASFYNEMAGKLKTEHGIDKVTLGTGGNTPKISCFQQNNFEAKNSLAYWKTRKVPSVKYKGKSSPYNDSKNQDLIIDSAAKINAEQNIPEIKRTNVKAIIISSLQNKNINIEDLQAQISKLSEDQLKEDMPLFLKNAIEIGNVIAVTFFIENGADVNMEITFPNNAFTTPLILAIQKWNVDIAKKLIEQKADVEQLGYVDPGSELNSPIACAITKGQIEIVKSLIDKGVALNLETSRSSQPLLLALEHKRSDILNVLLEGGANPNATCSIEFTRGISILKLVIGTIQLDDLKTLIAKGAAVDESILYEAARHLREDIIMELLDKKEITEFDSTLLDHVLNAESKDDLKLSIVKYLLQKAKRSKVEIKQSDLSKILLLAAKTDDKELVLDMLQRGADANTQGIDGKTPLHLAAEALSVEIVTMLLPHTKEFDDVLNDLEVIKAFCRSTISPKLKQVEEIEKIVIEHHIKDRDAQKRLLAATSTQTVKAALSSAAIPSATIEPNTNSDKLKLPDKSIQQQNQR
jgi:ankyrin repeat protein